MSQSPRKATKITFNANCSNTVSLEINQNMSTELDTIKIVEACIQHAIKYSLTHVHSSVHYCYSRVIPLASIQSMISKDFAVEAYEIVKLYTTLQTFFEQIYNEFDDKTKEQLKWIFKVMNYDEYQNDSRVFPPLKDVVYHYCPNGIQKLFVVYRVDDVDKLRDVLRDTIYESVLHNASNILTKEDIQNIEEDAHAYKQSEDQIKEYRDHIEEGEYQVNEGECHVEQNQDRVEKNNDHAEKNKDDIEQNQDSGKEYKKIEQEALEANDSQKTKADENEEDKKIGKEAFKVNDHQKTEPVYLDEYSFLTEELEVLNQVYRNFKSLSANNLTFV